MIQYIPILTTLLSFVFFYIMYIHYQQKKNATYIFWWMIGILCYGAGTVTESVNTLFGWNETNFRLWYITGALLGGWPLATGSAYLLLPKQKAHLLTFLGLIIIGFAALCTLLSPLNLSLQAGNKLTGKILEWTFIRYITPFINIYAFIMLVGGAIYSAIQYKKETIYKIRFWGNVLIAIGGLLPGIGGSFTKYGYTEVLYVTEFIGLALIFSGYLVMKNDRTVSIHHQQISKGALS
ncbi:MAG: hypothetical protein K2Y12_04565 [Chitinophagaceae bacterium]|nr:hypothetical protein [Chitinophagaceae bacterium]